MSLFRRLHHAVPPGFRKSYRFVIVFVEKIKKHIVPVTHYNCEERESGERVSLVHVGWDFKLCHYWLSRISDNFQTMPGKRHIMVWNISRYLKKQKDAIDLAIVESEEEEQFSWMNHKFLLTRWMEMILDIEIALKKSRINNIKRNIKKHELSFEIRDRNEDFDLFYHSMYVPFTAKRHGASADIADYKHFSNKFRSEESRLFFCIKNGAPVGAAYVESKEQHYRLSAFGILEGRDDIYAMGVLGALYYFVMIHYKQQGSNSFLVGNSMPLVFDGVTEFKMQIGAVPFFGYMDGNQNYHFVPMSDQSSVQYFLKANPLFLVDNGGFLIVSHVHSRDFGNYQDFQKYLRRLKYKQANRLLLYCFDESEKLSEWISMDDSTHIELIKFNLG